MGIYLTKMKLLFNILVPLQIPNGNNVDVRTPGKKRKRNSDPDSDQNFEDDHLTRIPALENGPNPTRERISNNGVLAPSVSNPGVSSILSRVESNTTNGVSLNQLNSIMNHINQPELRLNRDSFSNIIDESNESINNSDIQSLLYARNRLARITASREKNSKNIRQRGSKSDDSSSINLIYTAELKLATPARKKMKSTTEYIYTTLFLNGENSDLCITALNKEWKLHKIYLCQSPYFDSIFTNGSRWKESNQSSMHIAIPDVKINEQALFIAFGSFYREDIEIMPLEVVNVLACASLFSLDGLIIKCAEIMIDNINFKSVINFYEASLTYGVKSVTESTLKWLSHNLMSSNEFFLADLKLSLFEQVLSNSKDLLIIQVETDLYTLCKKWLYFQLNSKDPIPVLKLDKNWQKTCNDFFKSLLISKKEEQACDLDDSGTDDTSVLDVGYFSFPKQPAQTQQETQHVVSKNLTRKECLLDRPAFNKYIPLFKKIRLQHILCDMASLQVLYSDRIVPREWIEPHYFHNWLNTMWIDQDNLSHEFEICPEDFDKQCARFGRELAENTPATWRWVGYNYGIDLLLSHTNRTLTLKRNKFDIYAPYKGLLSQKSIQRIYYMMKIVKLDTFGNEKWSTQTDLTCLDLNRNDEKFVVTIDSAVQYPVLLSFRIVTHRYYANNIIGKFLN